MVKNPPANAKGWVQSLGQEDPSNKEMTTYQDPGLKSSMNRGPGGLQVHEVTQESDMT